MDHVTELIPAYVLGVLDPAEAELVDRHVAGCAACATELAEARETAGMLAFAAPAATPPPELRGRILDAVTEPELVAPPQPEPVASPEPRRPTEPRFGWWPRFARVAVPVLAACVIALVAWNVSLRHTLSNTNNAVYGSHTSVALGGVGTVFVQSNGTATLYADPNTLPSGKTYQAWIIPAGGKPVSAGTFGAGRSTLEFNAKADKGDTLAVTVEPSGGSPQPTTQPIAAGMVT